MPMSMPPMSAPFGYPMSMMGGQMPYGSMSESFCWVNYPWPS